MVFPPKAFSALGTFKEEKGRERKMNLSRAKTELRKRKKEGGIFFNFTPAEFEREERGEKEGRKEEGEYHHHHHHRTQTQSSTPSWISPNAASIAFEYGICP